MCGRGIAVQVDNTLISDMIMHKFSQASADIMSRIRLRDDSDRAKVENGAGSSSRCCNREEVSRVFVEKCIIHHRVV